jgi:Domain of unknown function (DUF4403)
MKETLPAAFAFLLAACASGTASSQTAVAPAPPPPPEISTIVVPIRLSLAPLLPELEKRVQSKFADKTTERGIDIRYEVTRDPLRLQMIGAGLHTSTTVNYRLEACRGRFPCISCGFNETPREADIKLHTTFAWDPSWRLRSTTKLLPVHYAKRCEVTWLGIDITRRFVAPVVEEQLNMAAKTIDRNTPALTSINSHAEKIWSGLQAPVQLAPNTWLVLEPNEVALGPITGSGTNVTTTLALRATTRVVFGAKPTVKAAALPALKTTPATAGGVRVPFDLHLPYDEASRLVSKEVAGKTLRVNGKPLAIHSIRLAPAPNGKVLIEADIDYRGGALRNYRGAVFLEGTPQFDPKTSTVTIPDLEYTLDPKRRGKLLRIVERAAHDTIRTRLRENRSSTSPRARTRSATRSRARSPDSSRRG